MFSCIPKYSVSNLSNPGDSYKKDSHKNISGNAIFLDFKALSSNSVFLVLMHLGPKKKL